MPYRPFTVAILVRGTVIWVAVRVAMVMGSGLGSDAPGPGWAVLISGGVVALVTALVRLDLARLNERLFLANLGVRTGGLTALAALPPLVLEALNAAVGPGGLAAAFAALSP